MKIHEEQAEIRKGAGLQLEQLTSQSREGTTTNSRIQPFDMEELEEAFLLSDMTPVELPLVRIFPPSWC